MNFYLCLASLCLGIAAAAPQLDPTLDAKWEQWKSQHRRTYGGNEDNWRRATWEKNLRMIEMHNLEYRAGKHSFRMEMNKFGDTTNEEFRQVMNGFTEKRFQGKTKGNLFREPPFVKIPESIDWRKKGAVTPAKNQGVCGSSWAFSATGSLEGQWFLKTGKLVSLSEQNLVDCSAAEGSCGCETGSPENAFVYVKEHGGIDTEESYPYIGMVGNCQYKAETAGANVTGYVDLPSTDESALKMAVATVGPISVYIDAGHLSFRFYESGVYYEPECSSYELTHYMLVVGYNVDEGTEEKYWIVKNSWGEDWGDKGYISMARDEYNHCGIATEATYPKV
ncbi:procathepsin L-like [Notamacropus eugenii]|uniref:procathepsin L-like n=1 Tax=Notamacropus eugenii TaxID=9315 RepID=UPI003B672C81